MLCKCQRKKKDRKKRRKTGKTTAERRLNRSRTSRRRFRWLIHSTQKAGGSWKMQRRPVPAGRTKRPGWRELVCVCVCVVCGQQSRLTWLFTQPVVSLNYGRRPHRSRRPASWSPRWSSCRRGQSLWSRIGNSASIRLRLATTTTTTTTTTTASFATMSWKSSPTITLGWFFFFNIFYWRSWRRPSR